MIFCTFFACALSAPTEKPPKESNLSLPDNLQVFSSVSINSPLAEKREKREDPSAPSSSTDNKRITLSQPDYQENKPPTFVHPVPVDQIIKNSHASPEIHS